MPKRVTMAPLYIYGTNQVRVSGDFSICLIYFFTISIFKKKKFIIQNYLKNKCFIHFYHFRVVYSVISGKSY